MPKIERAEWRRDLAFIATNLRSRGERNQAQNATCYQGKARQRRWLQYVTNRPAHAWHNTSSPNGFCFCSPFRFNQLLLLLLSFSQRMTPKPTRPHLFLPFFFFFFIFFFVVFCFLFCLSDFFLFFFSKRKKKRISGLQFACMGSFSACRDRSGSLHDDEVSAHVQSHLCRPRVRWSDVLLQKETAVTI